MAPEPAREAVAAPKYGFDDDGPVTAPPLRLLESPPLPPPDPDGDEVFADLEAGPAERGLLVNVVGVKFREAGRIYEFDAGELSLERGDIVVVESESGLVLGEAAVATARRMCANEKLRRVLRKADQNDERQLTRNRAREREALAFARARVAQRKLPMKVFRAEAPHGGHKLIFYFTCDNRIDFRDLLKDLSVQLYARIEMRQIGVRDEAKMVGGIGDCGRELCCSTFLPQFAPVSIRMAKDQGIVLNPARVSGQCGRLKCCLVYEEAQYRTLRKLLPKLGKRVTTEDGEGRVSELDVLRGRVRVSYPEGGSKTYAAAEVTPLVPPGAAAAEPAPEPDEPDGGDAPPGVPQE
jgi:cell fate regulator YaaT (PSP1 superfamily)